MECIITPTARSRRSRGAYTLIEVVVAAGLMVVVLGAVMSFWYFAERSFGSMASYIDLSSQTGVALDTMSRDIREAEACSTNGFTTTSMTLLMYNPTNGQNYTVAYNYNATTKELLRTYTNTNAASTNVAYSGQVSVLLSNCSSFAFAYYQRNPTSNAWGAFPIDTNSAPLCKVVQFSWLSGIKLLNVSNSESVESAQVVIRKE